MLARNPETWDSQVYCTLITKEEINSWCVLCAVFLMNFGVRPGCKYQFWYQLAGWYWMPPLMSLGLSLFRDKMALVIHGF